MHSFVEHALKQRRFFKLICGASYRNTEFIALLAEIFTHAGAQVIDVGAKPELVKAALAGIQRACLPSKQQPLVMVSIGINADLHFLRVEKDGPRCDHRGYCANACPHGVFVGSQIRLENCLGCDHCVKACPEKALTLVPREPLAEMRSRLGACLEAGASALEIHTGDGGRDELHQVLAEIKPYREKIGLLAFSLGAHGQDIHALLELVRDIVAINGSDILLQADGQPISGRKGKKSTLPCLDLAREILALKSGAYVQVSGGTNDLTGLVADEENIKIHGVGMGSFARKYIQLEPGQILSPAEKTQAIARASILVQSVVPTASRAV